MSNRYSRRAQLRARVKGPEMGFCQICGNYRKLTEDHIPPKGCVEIKPVVIDSFFSLNQAIDKQRYLEILQQGLYVKSICKDCNNARLGNLYDPFLINFVNQVARIINLKETYFVSLPNPINIQIKPHRVARAIIGHLLAAKPPSDKPMDYGPMHSDFQSYFMNQNSSLPRTIEIYFWIFPSEIQSINLTYSYMIGCDRNKIVLGDSMKFFPLGFWVIYKKPDTVDLKLNKLAINPDCGFNDDHTYEIDTSIIPPLNWPENPDDNSVVLFNSDLPLAARPQVKQ